MHSVIGSRSGDGVRGQGCYWRVGETHPVAAFCGVSGFEPTAVELASSGGHGVHAL